MVPYPLQAERTGVKPALGRRISREVCVVNCMYFGMYMYV